MKKLASLGALLLLSFTAQAAPTSTFTWTAPTQYEDGTMIPGSDVLSYRLYCGNTQGGPYNNSVLFSTPSPSQEDMAFCVQGVPGTYYMVATAISVNGEESGFSNETTRTYSAGDLGKIPLPPTLLQVQ
jgi:hypothetical protein